MYKMSTSSLENIIIPPNEDRYAPHSCEYTCTLLSLHSTAYHLPSDHRNVNISDTQTQSNPDSSERYTYQSSLRNVFSYQNS